MFHEIVLAVDGSDRDERAVRAAAALAETGGRVTVVHVVEQGRGGTASREGEGDRDAAAERAVDAATTTLGDLGIEVVARRAEAGAGGVGATIVDLAHDGGADTIVVGSRGLTDAKALLISSVTHDVIHFFRGCIVVAR